MVELIDTKTELCGATRGFIDGALQNLKKELSSIN